MGRFLGPSIAIAKDGYFGVSPAAPGGVWILRTSYPLTNVQTVGGNATRIVALDGAGNTAYSDDHGATWHLGSGLSAIDGQAIATNGTNLWVVSSSAGNIYTSSDGASWSHSANIGPLQGTPSIVFGNALFVLGAQSSAQVVDVYTSTDAVTWTGHGTATPNQMSVQLYDGTNFVASSQSAGGNPQVSFSTNGASWTSTVVNQFSPNNNILWMAFHSGVYVATDQSLPSVVQQSPSATWVGTNITQPLTDDVAAVAFGESVWCLVGDVLGGTVPQAATSTDLSTWTLEDLQMGTGGHEAVRGLVAAGGTLVAWTFNNKLSTRG